MTINTSSFDSREAWLAARKKYVNASTIGALFNAHPYTTALSVWAEKSGVPTKENVVGDIGHVMEPAIAMALELRQGWEIMRCGQRLVADEKLKLAASPDCYRLLEGGKIAPVELKFVQPHVFERDWSSGPPLAWLLQNLVQVYLGDHPHGHIACMVDNRAKDIFVYDVPRNDEAWGKIVAKVKELWWQVENKTMPAPFYSADLEALKATLPPNQKAEPLDLTADNMLPELLAEREKLKGEVQAAEERMGAIDAELVHKLNGAPEARLRGWRVTHKQQTRKEHLVKASTFSVLRITKLEGDENV